METGGKNCIASLMTAKTVAAISGIQLVGEGSEDILKHIFKPHKNNADFSQGQILHGFISDGCKDIDEVVIGCEGIGSFSINCHGNPLIVENILELLKKHNVRITEPQEILAHLAKQKYGDNTIAIEAFLTITQAQTFDGAKIIAHQTKMGLLQTAQWWQKNLNVMELEDIKSAAAQILNDNQIANLFINCAKVVIAGPPNSGKSTLFNYLCGKEKAIVTDIAGTTRDWLSAKIRLKKISVEFFDTAGLDEKLSGENIIDAQSQSQAVELIKNSDLVLLVLDAAKQTQFSQFNLSAKNVLTVFNKCDLTNNLLADGLKISAKTGSGIKELIEEIEQTFGIFDFDIKKTVCWTDRQKRVLEQIILSKTKQQIKKLIQELLKGQFVMS